MKGIFVMRSYLLNLWNIMDPIYYQCTRLCYVPGMERKNTIFRVRLTRYKGATVILEDGTVIKRNDVLIKIHLHNVRLISEIQSIDNEVKKAIHLYRSIRQALGGLAVFLEENKKYFKAKGILGITMLNQGAIRLGFEIVPIKNPFYRSFKKWTFFPINILTNASISEEPMYLFMSKEQLQKHYLS